MARVVVPGVPHHITQRGNRRQRTFFIEDDYRSYAGILARQCFRHGVGIWAYCLMPNHIHMIAVPGTADALGRAIGEAHRLYTSSINKREGWKGYLWQGRFKSNPMGETYLLAAARYIERNPVRAGLADQPWDWPWSSAMAHMSGADDKLVTVDPLLHMVSDWAEFLGCEVHEAPILRDHIRSGFPLGRDCFVEKCESIAGRRLRPGRRGRKRAGESHV